MTNEKDRVKIPLSQIKVGSRLRQDYGAEEMEALKVSIAREGLIQPIVVNHDYQLIAGGRRYQAHVELGKSEIDVCFLATLSPSHLRLLEVEENVVRKNMSWQEVCLSIAEIHGLKSHEAALSEDFKWTYAMTGRLINQSTGSVNNALNIAKWLRAGDKDIANAENMFEALKILLQRKENEAMSKMAKSAIGGSSLDVLMTELGDGKVHKPVATLSAPSSIGVRTLDENPGESASVSEPHQEDSTQQEVTAVPLSQMLFNMDSRTLLNKLPPECIDHCITDWPYAIDMANMLTDVSSTAAEHKVDENILLQLEITPLIFRVLKPGGFFITFYDIENHNFTVDTLTKAGFKVQRWPLIWGKSGGQNGAAQYNFTKDYEGIIIARKGNAILTKQQPSSLWHGNLTTDERTLFDHPFCKPTALWKWLYDAVAISGQTVLDPFAGTGSSVHAAVSCGLIPIACEKVEVHYNKMLHNVKQLYTHLLKGKVDFQ